MQFTRLGVTFVAAGLIAIASTPASAARHRSQSG